ncbi:hypothetical protein ACIHDR_28900 [Nocardia sp. NPDC052278]|uniref:hypothetical protein n=1 Tax=unclassified Nocardia TaxID=2637762 RepID=UPI0036CA7608
MSVPGNEQSQHAASEGPWGRVISALAAVVAVVGIGIWVGFFVDYAHEREAADAQGRTLTQRDRAIGDMRAADVDRETARKSACDYITEFTTYDFTDLDGFFAAARNGSTGAWLRQITEVEAPMREAMTQAQVHSSSTGTRCGLETLDPGRASVVAVVGRAVRNIATPQPQISQLSIVIDLTKQPDGRWLVDTMDAPGLLAPR